MNVNPVGMYNSSLCPDCSKKNNSPAFGMAIVFKESAINRIGKILTRTDPEYKDIFLKEVKPLVKKSEKNKAADVIIDTVPGDDLMLKATVTEDGEPVAEYVQSDLLSYDFIKQGVNKAEYIKNLKDDLNNLL